MPHAQDALEPHVDAATMKFHHDFHHQAYVNNLNKAMAGKDAASLVSLVSGSKGAKLNNTGGGGPGFAHFSAKGLSPADLEACRGRCCASPLCASVVLHEIKKGEFGCWLNPKGGTKAPYARPQTILAYVNRTAASAD